MPEKTSSLFEQLQVDSSQKQKLEDIDKKQLEIKQSDRQAISDYESTLQQMLEGKQDVKVETLSKLDAGIQRGKKFKVEISDLAESLTRELQDLGQFFGDMRQYKGVEVWVSKLLPGKADKMRLNRVKNADVKQNLQNILDYGTHMVDKLYKATLENMECHTKIDATIRSTARTLEENQPQYEKWRSEKEKLERAINALKDTMDKADATGFSQMVGQMAELDKKLQETRVNESYHFTIVDKAKQALPIQKTHLKAYADIIESLVQLRTGLEENIKHVTQIYLAVPTAIKTALSTKAASQYDRGMKYATGISTEAVLESAQGILDEAAKRAVRPLIEPERLDAYRKLQFEMRANFDESCREMQEKYAAPAASPAAK